MAKIRVLLVNHQALLRSALRLLLEAQPDMEVVGEAPNGRAALAKARETTPDVILLELSLPEAGGLQTIEQLRQACRHAEIVVLTLYQEAAYVRAVLAAGGAAYITTYAGPADLLTAIRTVARGQTFVDPAVAGPLLLEFLGKQASRPAGTPGLPRSLLSPREREVLIRLAQGYTNRQIAEQIYVSVKSVETYRARIVQKLELHSRADLIRYAHASGLLTPEMVLGRYDKAAQQ
jgi:two-component system, NarL family, response regulator NreC